MNEIKKLTFMDRICNAIKAFKGKPIGSVTYGLEITECKNCDKLSRNILYYCDKEACGDECPNPECYLTTDIRHAFNFHEAPLNSGLYIENFVPEVTNETEQD